MKKTVNVAIGGCSFVIDEDACTALGAYLDCFRASLDNTRSGLGVMEELEVRIADLLKQQMGGREVVSLAMVEEVTRNIGYPQGYREADPGPKVKPSPCERPVRKLFRDSDGKKIAGVCSGLSIFLGIDVTLVRVLFLIALICGSAGFWVYVVIWIAAPEARTAVEKCELRGIPATAENIRRFTEVH